MTEPPDRRSWGELCRGVAFSLGMMTVLIGGSALIGWVLGHWLDVHTLWVTAPVSMLYGVSVALGLWHILRRRFARRLRENGLMWKDGQIVPVEPEEPPA